MNTLSRKTAIVFDMDGLLLDSEITLFRLWRELYDGKLPLPTLDFYITLTGCSRTASRQKVLEYFSADYPWDEVLTNVHEHMMRVPIPCKPYARELVLAATEHGLRLAVATGSDRAYAEAVLKNAGLFGSFECMVCGNELSRSKPAPDIFLEAARRLELLPSDILILEDSANGVLAASAAGIDVICVPDLVRPDPEILKKAFATVPSLKEVLSIMQLDTVCAQR